MKAGILGSSDLDQTGRFMAALMASLMVQLTWNFIHTGQYQSTLMKKRFEKQMKDPDPYNRAFVRMTGIGRYDMSYIKKESIRNQFYSDLVTPLPEQIDNGETEIHVFYAKKMGRKYLERYRKHFKNPVIHELDLRHEEYLGVYPQEWCGLVREICLKEKQCEAEGFNVFLEHDESPPG